MGGIFGYYFSFQEISNNSQGPNAVASFAIMQGIMIALIVVGVIWTLGAIVFAIAGFGIQKRRVWGRNLGIVVGILAGLSCLLLLLTFWPLVALYMPYSIFTLVVLLNGQNKSAFR